ncbi:DUF1156 domain-containing protein [Ornithinimicrobium tianjinense]|uniref:DUF1156 domain-containing protein n=1 Tax=Ornithinimicrobium tianjinense TaxID=1195761 RepID=A0A917BGK2_9MICO|nr:DUF1156 domain-containing protein [Ornithinimicrobium tianjinense]GGF40067.1 hypothetical protein GCM10011366_04590 [Ornithinimicrobium tianjinense]
MAETPRRKLIEVALPLEVINRESAREKSIRHGHPSTLHLWWARRPLAAARAVLFAQLVDDPSAHPDRFPTEEDQRVERERLHRILERLVPWEATRDERVLEEARQEILKSTNGNPPPILDPFAGGGTIPLEAQRLGLEAHASDLNPVAVLINKALIEIPPKFANRPPVHPSLQDELVGWQRAQGLAADVRAYGEWMREEAQRRIGHLYPKAVLPDGTKATVIAWIWARTVPCPNPACGIEMPLVRSWWLGKKKGKEAYVIPSVAGDPTHPSGLRVKFDIGHDKASAPTAGNDGTVGRTGARCIACQTSVSLEHIRSTSRQEGLGSQLMAVVAEGKRCRIYLPPSEKHIEAAAIEVPDDVPSGELFDWPGRINVYRYGLTHFSDLFTPRQLSALTTFSDVVMEARENVLSDALAAGHPEGARLEEGGTDAAAYADAVAIHLACAVARIAMTNCNLGRWNSTGEKVQHVFGRQAIPMVWDFPEVDVFGSATGTLAAAVDMAANAQMSAPAKTRATVEQTDARDVELSGLLSTDPPYYDNVGYSDLSDFFYVWHRKSLRRILPSLFNTLLSPKAEELVANQHRHGDKEKAKQFFEHGFQEIFRRARIATSRDFPITVYYAFKQSESGISGESSTGWETLLDGMIEGGWSITATWPMRTEMATRMVGQGANALSSSIVLALRPRPDNAPTTDRRGFIAALHAELPDALRKLQQGAIAPVDLPQAAIGPGMAVFSRYSAVLEPDGSPMSVRSALERINEILDQVLAEQETDFDSTTRFAIAWYRQHGYGTGKYGDADNLARARNTAVDALERYGILTARAGNVTLLRPADLDVNYDVSVDSQVSTWEVLHHVLRTLEADGIIGAGAFLAEALSRAQGDVEADLLKELGHLIFRISEQDGRTKDAIAFNSVVTSWPDIVAAAGARPVGTQNTFTFEEN